MDCPECKKQLKPRIPEKEEISLDTGEHTDVDFECENGHIYFVRIKQDDLIEANKLQSERISE